ncbi:MAG: alpha/beta hydrolase-fold protein [Jaaginema sp. PMC 1079.18]|nr:alpha/beta hydrolase-fold protein [Jaaginema sp. PMC 1080.18]MEC4853025.1 alpha/beta hydrolase-fold protein [Jaaginema sp. PMC 1079.18]MEC4869185.1 alpha/beta hydrolase-fold protein [Jaaginema sp. PMC 1078.18]
MTHPFAKGGQWAWFHDENHPGGYFHTYDALRLQDSSPRKVHVFLPREYEQERDRYPVVYMNDGHTAFFPGGIAHLSWDTATTLSQLYAAQAIQKLIVVAIHPLNRDWEYTHVPILSGSGGGLGTYSHYLAHFLKPFIDEHYRTQSQASQTTILGSSHGGLAAFYTACQYPQQFGNAGALSPSFWVELDASARLFDSLESSKLLKLTAPTLENKQIRPLFWLDWGRIRSGGFHNWFIERHAAKRTREMAHLLQQEYDYTLGKELFVYEDFNGEHTEISWAKRLPFVLRALYPPKSA